MSAPSFPRLSPVRPRITTALVARAALVLLPIASVACHEGEVRSPLGSASRGPVPESVRCHTHEGHFEGAGEVKTAAERDAWIANHAAKLRERLGPETCADSFVALVQSTDFSTHVLRIENGYEASLGIPASDDGRTVTLATSRVCGGAYPSSAMQVIRIARGRAVRTELRGGECSSGAP